MEQHKNERNYVLDFNGCWRWASHLKPNGYASRIFYKDGKPKRVYMHRWFYEKLVGPISPGLTIDHLCKTKDCVNPNHLEPVLHRTNNLRGNSAAAVNARKTHCPQGHALSANNITPYFVKNRRRECRLCRNTKQNLRKNQKKHAQQNKTTGNCANN